MVTAHQVSTRRQRRGLERMRQILEAAAVVFGRDGFDGATTNAIAAAAGISPGSLYQFFHDKVDIARALGEQYAAELTDLHERTLTAFDHREAPIENVLDSILDPIVAFKDAHSAFVALFGRPDLPATLREPVVTVEEAFAVRIAGILGDRNPTADASELRLAARTMINMFRGVVGQLGVITGDPHADLLEIKVAMTGYLAQKGLR